MIINVLFLTLLFVQNNIAVICMYFLAGKIKNHVFLQQSKKCFYSTFTNLIHLKCPGPSIVEIFTFSAGHYRFDSLSIFFNVDLFLLWQEHLYFVRLVSFS